MERIDQIINCSNVELLKFKLHLNLNIHIRRLDNGDVLINSGDPFFGGIYRQQRMNNISIENRCPLDFPALYLNFKTKENHIYVYPSNNHNIIENKLTF
ncbi:hypothetical protein DFA_09292 [Cavenderia fasciculata]|uniref:Uncharacterized protein n=1 Tax=Cavenderia fasciculata TaxID=261658 RepID=F4Q780_CACFS|nr:uncharacterized protein DFA_09292 [Cavenderia fasciculata]EGG16262.1 hypothetical protein DFA_09292 [Cavenderia fasciculata]|eukprot:XP_004354646.1 hypothetical protein DFA_09292 [Cavenderia fasciculata]